ncbi:MAG TPA: two-component regulator propeller domain-containing protein [Bacteroidia bacterium]|nr:two-component regulator propeller domain-containing protein [Bacteroidia bacterium]
MKLALYLIKKQTNILLFFIPQTIFVNFLFAQKYNFTTYTVADGLPNNQINDIFQDQTGKLWIGTMNGACTFDGKNFTKFSQDNILSNNSVKNITQDSKGNIWLGVNRKGACMFNGTDFKFFTLNEGLLSDIVNAICEDKEGNIWIGTSDGLSKYDGKKFTSITTSAGLVNNNVYSIFRDHDDNLWISTIGGISKFNGKEFTNYTTDNGLANNISYCITQSVDKKIWIGTKKGISSFDGKSFKNYYSLNGLGDENVRDIVEDSKGRLWFASDGGGVSYQEDSSFLHLTHEEGLSNDNVLSAIIDREGNFWFGTTNGLSKYTGDRFITFTSNDGLSNNNILSIFADTSGNIFFGTVTGGINCYDGHSIRNIKTNETLNSTTIRSIIRDKEGYYWMGTTSGPARLNFSQNEIVFPVTYLNSLIIYTIMQSRNGTFYFGTDKGIFVRKNIALKRIDAKNGLTNENVRVLFEDNKGVIWAGTLKGAYYLIGDTAVSFTELYNLPKAPVTSIIQDEEGNMIMSTFDFGIIKYSRDDKIKPVTVINKSSGLINDRLLFTFLDKDKKLWLGTPEGIDCINWAYYLKDHKLFINHFDKSNGYFGVETNAACDDRDGNVWFGSVNGAIRYNLKSGISRQSVPLVSITNIQLFLENVDWKKKNVAINTRSGLPENPVFPYDNNYLSFYFSGVYLTQPDEVQYRFMLEGFEDNWSPPTKQMIANYSNIPPGNYIFKIKASANLKDWSNPVTYGFEITPPIWKTKLFYMLYMLTVIGVVFLFLRIRTRNLKRSQNQLRKKVELRTRELKAKNLELAKLSLVASETDNAVMIFDQNKELEWVNEGFTKLTGYAISDIKKAKGKTIFELTTNPEIETILENCISKKKSSVYESVLNKKNGETAWVASTLNPIFNEEGRLRNIVIIDTDITLRKMMEEQIRESLEEKGLLLKEIHHRVKNNLQIIISLFNLQSNYITDNGAYKAFKEGQDRVKAMALIHERFYQSDGTSKINFDEYILRLAENLFLSLGKSQEQVALKIDSEKISLDIDSAVPCGLILNELVSNSLKHAFPDEMSGTVFIGFHQIENDRCRLVIRDNGIGFPEDFDLTASDSLGMQLVLALADQLEGTIKLDKTNGTTFIIEFKKKTDERKEEPNN